jgi:hypothetical protein
MFFGRFAAASHHSSSTNKQVAYLIFRLLCVLFITGLANESIRISERVSTLQGKIDDLSRRMPEFKTNLDKMQTLKNIGRERMLTLCTEVWLIFS